MGPLTVRAGSHVLALGPRTPIKMDDEDEQSLQVRQHRAFLILLSGQFIGKMALFQRSS